MQIFQKNQKEPPNGGFFIYTKFSLEIFTNICKTTHVKHFIFVGKREMNCKKCHGDNIIKYGTSAKSTQRFLCHDCHSTFTVGGLKKDYSQSFIDGVMDEYCHQHKTAKQVINEHKISSRTLVNRKHKHKQNCEKCQSE